MHTHTIAVAIKKSYSEYCTTLKYQMLQVTASTNIIIFIYYNKLTIFFLAFISVFLSMLYKSFMHNSNHRM